MHFMPNPSMKKLYGVLITNLFLTSLTIAQQSDPSQAVRVVELLKPGQKEIFKLRDFNSDGLVNGKEYESSGSGARHYDLNNDGLGTAVEYGQYFEPKPDKIQTVPSESTQIFSSATIKPTPGKYTCFGYGLNASGGTSYSYVYKGHFFLKSDNKYEANNTIGSFSLTAVGGKTMIAFSQGAYSRIKGEVTFEKDGPKIVLTWPPGKQGGSPSLQYCTLTR